MTLGGEPSRELPAVSPACTPSEFGRRLDALMRDDGTGDVVGRLRGDPGLQDFFPELARCDGFDQRSPWHPEGDLYVHVDNVYRRVCALTPDPDLRWLAVLHDIGKPESFWLDSQGVGHFYASKKHKTEHHEIVGARIARSVLQRFDLSPRRVERITTLVRQHMRRPTSTTSVERMINELGREAFDDLVLFSIADHESGGDPEAYSKAAWAAASEVPGP